MGFGTSGRHSWSNKGNPRVSQFPREKLRVFCSTSVKDICGSLDVNLNGARGWVMHMFLGNVSSQLQNLRLTALPSAERVPSSRCQTNGFSMVHKVILLLLERLVSANPIIGH